jgi:ubiquinone/menaquinone biosynthesis C-methylase UbiE
MNSLSLFDFDKIASVYDQYYATEQGKKIDDLEKFNTALFFNDLNSKNVLEIGCGTGHWTQFLSHHGFEITALDTSDAMLEIAMKKNIKNAQFVKGSATELPFEDESIENIMSFATLGFIKNKEKAIKEMHRVLKKNGYILIGALNKNSVWYEENKSNEIYKSANFFDYESLYKSLADFGSPQIQSCIYMEKGRLLDEDNLFAGEKEKGGFLIGISQKIFL